ncbi:MAG TPA: hypothetical protein GXZ77_02450 [Papillibacter sp.]|jgi:hypothetical protein|nr:hypothetical protein [Papillibacter sp.]
MSAPRKKHAKKAQEETKNNMKIAMRATVVIIVLLLAFALFINSSILVRNATAVEIEGVKYTVADFNYFFQNAYNEYYMTVQSAQGPSSMLPQTGKPLKSQIYDEGTGETWSDFFRRLALVEMKETTNIYKKAVAEGFTLADETREKMEDEIKSLSDTVTLYGYKKFDDYLQSVYGNGMTEAIYRRNVERTYVVEEYTKQYEESLNYSQDELNTYYGENEDSLDFYKYRYFLVRAEAVDEEALGYDEEAIEKAKEEALEKARVRAEEYAGRVNSEEDFITVAREYDSEQYADDNSTLRFYKGELLGSAYGPWLRDAGRVEGDVTTSKIVSGYYVVYFISRNDNRYVTHNIRYLTIAPNSVQYETGTEEEKAAKLEENKKEAETTANTAFDQWLQMEGTEDAFLELAKMYEGVTNVITESGQLENVYLSQLPKMCEEWLYSGDRTVGDSTLLHDPEVGYYLLYYTGEGRIYRDVLAEEGLRERDMRTWKESMTAEDAKLTWFIRLGK